MSFGEDHPGQGHQTLNCPKVDDPIVVPAGVDITQNDT